MIDYDLTNFIQDGICRKERQYALFLYNIFLKKKNNIHLSPDFEKIINACLLGRIDVGEPVIIRAVYYEATFMRDYFEADRKNVLECSGKTLQSFRGTDILSIFKNSFNYRLLNYCIKKNPLTENKNQIADQIIDIINNNGFLLHNWGNNKVSSLFSNNSGSDSNEDHLKSDIMKHVKQMMNSKPDIAVIYSIAGSKEKILRLFECKYLSGESGNQREIQNHIADFLCNDRNDIKADEVHISGNDNNIIQFKKDIDDISIVENTRTKKTSVNIPLNWLIREYL